jgi:hypothetical protein
MITSDRTLAENQVRFGGRVVGVGSPEMGRLRDSNAIADDPQALRARMDEDGYLLIRGLYDADEVGAARREIFQAQQDAGWVTPGTDPALGLINPSPPQGAPCLTHGSAATRGPAFLRLVERGRVMRFFDRLFGEQSITFDFKWLRLVRDGDSSPGHFDNSYMGRGSARLYTVWTPLGAVRLQDGPLTIVPRSHAMPAWARLRETLGMMDVDRDQVRGNFADDPFEFTSRFGGQWATSDFAAGDALIFGMFTLHASAENCSGRFRLSSDTRYQPAAEPADERWMGEKPIAHYAWWAGQGVQMADKRRDWGL